MIETRTGDILACDVEALVNTVNCVGVMGRGMALQFKKAYPANYKAYKRICQNQGLSPGQMFVYETCSLMNPKYIINFPTKRHWKGKSRMEDVESGLEALRREILKRKIKSIAVPPLASGLGGLLWSDVRPRIERALAGLDDVLVVLFEPHQGTNSHEIRARSSKVPEMTAGRAALIALMDRYLAGLLDPFVTLLEVHKLLYFMQEAHQRLRLTYAKGPYGPYAENLRHVLHKVEGHFVSGFLDGGEQPDKRLNLVPGAVQDAARFLQGDRETQARIERLSSLVDGFETPFGLELLSTVHWVVTREGATNSRMAAERTYGWNARKKRFSVPQIELAYQVLRDQDWFA